jgi:hypothetical protein
MSGAIDIKIAKVKAKAIVRAPGGNLKDVRGAIMMIPP